jgi:hypothetical protein
MRGKNNLFIRFQTFMSQYRHLTLLIRSPWDTIQIFLIITHGAQVWGGRRGSRWVYQCVGRPGLGALDLSLHKEFESVDARLPHMYMVLLQPVMVSMPAEHAFNSLAIPLEVGATDSLVALGAEVEEFNGGLVGRQGQLTHTYTSTEAIGFNHQLVLLLGVLTLIVEINNRGQPSRGEVG